MSEDEARALERRGHAESILRAAITAADTGAAVRNALTGADVGKAFIIAIGKAAGPMVLGALDTLPRRPDRALAVVPHGTSVEPRAGLHVLYASHPLPDESSAAAGRAIVELLRSAGRGTTVVALISGGASSLAIAPADPVTVEDYAETVQLLLRAGADIATLNGVRSRIDVLKGGGTARLAAPARVLGLVVSDVVGNALDVIASGPLTPSRISIDAVIRTLEELNVLERLPRSVRDALTRDTPVASSYDHVDARTILDNRIALEGAAREAARLGYDVVVQSETVTGEARNAGERIARDAMDRPRTRPLCILYGGETTVHVGGAGTGGRNQELVLAAALALNGTSGITVGSIGTDGVDGPTDAAGAVADGLSVSRGAHIGCDAVVALERNDSHSFFAREGGIIRTGPTGTNVMDVQVVLIDAQ